MDKIILGLLLINPMSLYEIRSYIQRKLNSFCSDSIGSIQAALKKLMTNQEVECQESVEHGVMKKTFSITQVGIEKFKLWIASPITFSKSRDMEGSKLFFLGMAEGKVRLEMLEAYKKDLQKEQQYLQQIHEFVEATKEGVIEENVKRCEENKSLCGKLQEVSNCNNLEEIVGNIYRYQLSTLEYGLKKCAFDISWIEEMLIREKNLERRDEK
ncbi:MAG: PadR family transcriptional regulator [Clostridiales bacterium]|nr:PadR family transcriptional regulator [Clostridiales bacterium]